MEERVYPTHTHYKNGVVVKPGRTVLAYADDVLISAEVFTTPEAAQQAKAGHDSWHERMCKGKEKVYADLGLPLPPQFVLGYWKHEVR